MKLKTYMRLMNVLLVLTILACFAVGIVGCQGTPVKASDVRNKQAAYENKIRRCTRVGGVWYHFGGTRGKCVYYPKDQ